MRIVSKNKVGRIFNPEIYQNDPIYISSEDCWDGGIRTEDTLQEKATFYMLANQMSAAIKEIISLAGGEAYIGYLLCEYEKIYADWSDLEEHELFRMLSSRIRENKCYQLSLPKDSSIIDLIVEANFQYLSYISFYLPKTKVVLQPTCHTEVLVYSRNTSKTLSVLSGVIKKYCGTLRIVTEISNK